MDCTFCTTTIPEEDWNFSHDQMVHTVLLLILLFSFLWVGSWNGFFLLAGMTDTDPGEGLLDAMRAFYVLLPVFAIFLDWLKFASRGFFLLEYFGLFMHSGSGMDLSWSLYVSSYRFNFNFLFSTGRFVFSTLS